MAEINNVNTARYNVRFNAVCGDTMSRSIKPVAIVRHSPFDGPGYFATFLDSHRIAWRLICIDAGDPVPAMPREFSGIGLMGGPMSVNDTLSWIPELLGLIRTAVSDDIPVIGHCLGGQLMARALGGQVTVNAVKEIGWHDIMLTDRPASRNWFGHNRKVPVFQWHGDTFSLPPQAVRLASSDWCENQAFAMGKHLGLQCHVEMTRELVQSWCDSGGTEIAASTGPGVQSVENILNDIDPHVAALNAVAERIYLRWIAGLKHHAG
jgi:GMP synthase-like glutamine amidotransferase